MNNNARTAALMIAALAAGAGGRSAIDALRSSADAATMKPIVHAVDLRRAPGTLEPVRVAVWGSAVGADGGVLTDLSAAKACTPSKATMDALSAGMNALSTECNW